MDQKRKSNLTTTLLLLLPVLFFAGIALVSRGKKWGKPAKQVGEFSFIVEDIQIRRFPLDKSKNWRMNVKVFVGQRGRLLVGGDALDLSLDSLRKYSSRRKAANSILLLHTAAVAAILMVRGNNT
jgi:hypothetical protein